MIFRVQLLILNDFCLFLYSCLPLFLIHVLYFFYSFHLDAPTTIPTPTTNPVNTQGTVCPHYCPSQQSYVWCVCVCTCMHV